ncbi:DUF2752 domain-containing protein [Polyangium aurulentum]|uniref:DUF2752 domain-containing protein n=1 Tax=Polyangium aurulentum TaxID=2567896 RepID=UPI0010ADC7DE|nr:DUF2752 domain-containing protein [Polyangium aurulentum]UQA61937.1 DUF2752 domain-containing protein [Polyangium aurulentum]
MKAFPVAFPWRRDDDARVMGTGPRRWHALRALASLSVLAPLALAIAISFLVTPDDIESGRVVLSPPCLFKLVVGRPCPTCGLTRAFAALSHGQFSLATSYHRASIAIYALFWIGAIVAATYLLRATLEYVRLGRSGENT